MISKKLSNIKTRFAPSPTGYLHIGNMRTAIINYLFAKKHDGQFILRIDDTDIEKVKNEYIENIFKDLFWLQLDYEYYFNQSKQKHVYDYFIKKLIEQNIIYPCFETEEELNIQRDIAIKSNKPFIYNRNFANISQEDMQELLKQGRKPYYRFKIEHKEITWNDIIKGEVKYHGKNLSDPIVIRSDGNIIYILASVIDDCMANITHIIRGEDHITNTAFQVQMFDAIIKIANQVSAEELNLLDLEHEKHLLKTNNEAKKSNNHLKFINFKLSVIPQFGHLGLVRSRDAKISKRVGGFSILSLRDEKHINPNTIKSFLTFIGTSKNIIPYINEIELLDEFGMNYYSASGTEYSETDIMLLNKKIMHKLPYAKIKEKFPNISENFWETVKMNIENENDLFSYEQMIFNPQLKQETNLKSKIILELFLEYVKISMGELELQKIVSYIIENYSKNIISSNITDNNLQNLNKKEVYNAIRISLTGHDYGPEIKALLALIKKDIIIDRLNFCIYGDK